ncbi:unnamed protein product [Rhizophagus irregularis]|uniref:Uncharacterized protein n=1 Tax=Rhizophagus irregularis TaxID=588596 RepID=A0A916EAY7_9GLOM|nr:unnamed protein product [Rhizophagus irregularis]CAB5373712.1 unnamed protein product [Rhizophagus irregularis]
MASFFRYRLIWIRSWIWYQFLQLWGMVLDLLALDFGRQRLGVFSLRTISVFGPSEPKEPPERAYQVP